MGRIPARITPLLAAIFLAGCSSEGSGGDYSQYFQAVKQMWSGEGRELTLQQVSIIPYATIGYRIGDGPQGLLILATDTQGQRLWTAEEHVVLITVNGRILNTAGLPQNVAMSGPNVSGPAAALTANVTTHWIADFADIGRYAADITCTSRRRGNETVSILGQNLAAIRIDENCNAASMAWSFVNTYWVDVEGSQVLRSIQHIHPEMEPIEIETLRPAE